jgi:hypothetical protein
MTERLRAENQRIEAQRVHTVEQYDAEVRRSPTLRHQLAELGIAD